MPPKRAKAIPPDDPRRPAYERSISELLRATNTFAISERRASSRSSSRAAPIRSATPGSIASIEEEPEPPESASTVTARGRNQVAPKSSAAGISPDPEEFYGIGDSALLDRLTASPSARTGPSMPRPGVAAPQDFTEMEQFPAESTTQPPSRDLGVRSFDLYAARLDMDLLWAAKMMVQRAQDHEDLDSPNGEKHPLHEYRTQLEQILFELTEIVTRVGNSKLVKDYERNYTVPKASPWYGKSFNKLVPGDAEKMLSGVQAVVDYIKREIRREEE